MEIKEVFKDFFVQTASGKALDYIGVNHGVTRKTNEDDESYRARIIPIWMKHQKEFNLKEW